MMMQFACTARSADDEDYRPLAETPLTLDFAYDHGVSTLADPAVWQVTLTNNADAPWRGVVKLEHCVAYDAPRFFLPGFLYGRNRGEAPIRVDNRYPRLRAGTPEFPASPWWMVRADRLSHPAAFLLDGGRWYGLSAAPYFVRQNGVLQPWQPGRAGTFAQFAGFTCSLNTGSVGYTLGYENAPWLFVQSHNIKPRAPMGENCLTLAAGESVAFPLYLYDFVAVDGERTLYAALEETQATTVTELTDKRLHNAGVMHRFMQHLDEDTRRLMNNTFNLLLRSARRNVGTFIPTRSPAKTEE